jgi:hypothetical protein
MLRAMPAVAAVKEMQDRTYKHQEIRQNAEDMRGMLGE